MRSAYSTISRLPRVRNVRMINFYRCAEEPKHDIMVAGRKLAKIINDFEWDL